MLRRVCSTGALKSQEHDGKGTRNPGFKETLRRVCSTRSFKSEFPTADDRLTETYELLRNRKRTDTTERTPEVNFADLENMEYVGSGNFAEVYKAALHEQTVAVKIALSPERENMNQILSEQAILTNIIHVNCINILGSGNTLEDDPRPFLVLEYLGGGDMKTYLSKEMRRSNKQRTKLFGRKKEESLSGPRFQHRLNLCIQLAGALAYLHLECLSAKNQALLHRDLKPANILLTSDEGRLVLADFGIAKPQNTSASGGMDDPYTMTGETGTLRYMAPENARCEAYGVAVDIYSFGVLAWQVLTLRVPFQGVSTANFMDRVVKGNERPAISEEWPLALGQLLQRCWAPDPNDRPPMDQVKAELDPNRAVDA